MDDDELREVYDKFAKTLFRGLDASTVRIRFYQQLGLLTPEVEAMPPFERFCHDHPCMAKLEESEQKLVFDALATCNFPENVLAKFIDSTMEPKKSLGGTQHYKEYLLTHVQVEKPEYRRYMKSYITITYDIAGMEHRYWRYPKSQLPGFYDKRT